jgi:hypothetical protein
MNLYLENGYLDMASIIESNYPFIFVPAARGTGKTYGSLKYHIEHNHKILLIRRTKTEAELQAKAESTSYKTVFDDMGITDWSCTSSASAGYGTVQIGTADSEHERIVAYVSALNTFANIRGIDFSDVDYIVYDEFIAEPHVRKIKNEGMALANLYESVNRNRELNGRPPVQLLCLANSVNMANDPFMYFNLIEEAEKMLQEGREISELGNKLLIIPQHSPVSERKADTALYKAVSDEYAQMAIHNKFILNDFTYVQKRSLKEYTCVFKVGDLYVYKHKSMHEYYVTFTRGQTKKVYTNGYADLTRFRREKWRFAGFYLDGLIRFENYRSVALWEKYFAI